MNVTLIMCPALKASEEPFDAGPVPVNRVTRNGRIVLEALPILSEYRYQILGAREHEEVDGAQALQQNGFGFLVFDFTHPDETSFEKGIIG